MKISKKKLLTIIGASVSSLAVLTIVVFGSGQFFQASTENIFPTSGESELSNYTEDRSTTTEPKETSTIDALRSSSTTSSSDSAKVATTDTTTTETEKTETPTETTTNTTTTETEKTETPTKTTKTTTDTTTTETEKTETPTKTTTPTITTTTPRTQTQPTYNIIVNTPAPQTTTTDTKTSSTDKDTDKDKDEDKDETEKTDDDKNTSTSKIKEDVISYPDTRSDKFSDSIEFITDLGIVQGYPDGTYRPDNTVTRAELLKIVMLGLAVEDSESVNMQRTQQYGNTQCFSDVPPRLWFTPYVCLGEAMGIVEGYEDGTFKPGQAVTFAEAVKITLVAFDIEYSETNPWYLGIIQRATFEYLIPINREDVNDPMRRSSMAELITRAVKRNRGELKTYLGIE